MNTARYLAAVCARAHRIAHLEAIPARGDLGHMTPVERVELEELRARLTAPPGGARDPRWPTRADAYALIRERTGSTG